MSKSLRHLLGSFFIIVGLAIFSFGQEGSNHKPRNINDRQHNQKDRIKDGVKDGDISRKELRGLTREQIEVRRMEERLRNSGDEFTKAERARVQRQLNQSSRHIRRASRN